MEPGPSRLNSSGSTKSPADTTVPAAVTGDAGDFASARRKAFLRLLHIGVSAETLEKLNMTGVDPLPLVPGLTG